MPKIPPRERYTHREAASRVSLEAARAWAQCFFAIDSSTTLARISGGYSNANFAVTHKGEKLLLRVFPGGEAVAKREMAILALAARSGIKVPKAIDLVCDEKGAAGLQEFIHGDLLLNVLESPDTDRRELFGELGGELARVHSIRFPKPGIFSPSGEVEAFYEGRDAGLDFLKRFLADLAGQRLGLELTRQLLSLVEREWDVVRRSAIGPTLVHCDFNPKNILVRGGEVAAVLDWEFAIAADPLIDFGNFFRFVEDYSPWERESLLDGYVRSGGSLPLDWRRAARLHDLVSMCAFLADPEEHPESFRTARAVIEETISD